MPVATAGERTLVPYESIHGVTKGDTARLKDGETISGYDGAAINRALRNVDVKVVNVDPGDNTVFITVGEPATNRHWVKFHQLVQVVNSPAIPAPASDTEWVPITDAEHQIEVGDTVRVKASERYGSNEYGGLLNSQVFEDGTVIVTRVHGSRTFEARGAYAGGSDLNFHPRQFEMQRPLSTPDTPATKWENYESFGQAKVGDVVRFRADKVRTGFDGDIRDEWRGIEATIEQIDTSDSSVKIRVIGDQRSFPGRNSVWSSVSALERQVPVVVTPALDPHKVSSYTPDTEWKMVEKRNPARWWIVRFIPDSPSGQLREFIHGEGNGNGTFNAEDWEARLRAGETSSWEFTVIKGGLKDAAPPEPATPKPEMYTEEWFKGFMERALDHANDHNMCGEVEAFLEAEGIDHGKLTEKTAVVDVTVTVQIEVDMSGRRAYDEGDLKYEVEKAVSHELRNLDTSAMTDARAQGFDAVRTAWPTVSAKVAEVRAR